MTSFSSTAHASTSTLRPPSDFRTRPPHYSPSTHIWSPQCNLCNMYSYVTSLRWPCALTKNRNSFERWVNVRQSTSRRKLPVDVNSVLGHTIEKLPIISTAFTAIENSLLSRLRSLVRVQCNRNSLLLRVDRGRHYFSHCSSGPPVHFTHQTWTISSFGYLLWRNKRHCYPFYYSQKKVSKRIWTHTLRTSSVMQCYTSLYPLCYEQLTAARVV